MSDDKVTPETPASPDAAPSKAHGDAFLDESGSRHGVPAGEPTEEGDGEQPDEAG